MFSCCDKFKWCLKKSCHHFATRTLTLTNIASGQVRLWENRFSYRLYFANGSERLYHKEVFRTCPVSNKCTCFDFIYLTAALCFIEPGNFLLPHLAEETTVTFDMANISQFVGPTNRAKRERETLATSKYLRNQCRKFGLGRNGTGTGKGTLLFTPTRLIMPVERMLIS